jgi:hypothetical protein
VSRFIRRAALFVLRRFVPASSEEKKRERPSVATAPRHEVEGAARDRRSFEQRRRGGPLSGTVPGPEKGPHHLGGARTRGRNEFEARVLDELPSPFETEIQDEIEDEVRAEERKRGKRAA